MSPRRSPESFAEQDPGGPSGIKLAEIIRDEHKADKDGTFPRGALRPASVDLEDAQGTVSANPSQNRTSTRPKSESMRFDRPYHHAGNNPLPIPELTTEQRRIASLTAQEVMSRVHDNHPDRPITRASQPEIGAVSSPTTALRDTTTGRIVLGSASAAIRDKIRGEREEGTVEEVTVSRITQLVERGDGTSFHTSVSVIKPKTD